jgi:hypothetical protein
LFPILPSFSVGDGGGDASSKFETSKSPSSDFRDAMLAFAARRRSCSGAFGDTMLDEDFPEVIEGVSDTGDDEKSSSEL